MARKKIQPATAEVDPEAVPTQEVEAIHTVKYKQPMRVPIEVQPDEPEEEEEDFEEEIEIDEEKPKRRAPQPTFRNKIKQKFLDRGIGGGELISLRIDQMPNYSVDGISGINAEKIFCDAVKVTEDYFDNDAYLSNILRKFGPGDYWLTARVKNSIVHNWIERIGAPGAASPSTRTEGESGYVFQNPLYPAPQAPAIAPKSLKEQLSEAVDLLTLVRKIDGRSEANTQQIVQAPISEDVQLASILMKDPDIKAKAIKGLLGTAGQEADLMTLVIENLDKILTAGGKALEGVIQTAVVGVQQIKAQNGDHQNGQAQAERQNSQMGQDNGDAELPGRSHNNRSIQEQEKVPMQVGTQNVQSYGHQGANNENPNSNGASPEDQALDFILGQCAQKVPIKIAADRLFNVAEEIRKKAPANSIDGYVEMFADTPLDFLVQWLGSTYPDSQTILDMPHAKDWIAGLQEEVRRQINEGGEDEG